LVDTSGLPIAWYVPPADLSDSQGARRLLGGLASCVPRLKTIRADAAYRGNELAEWCKQQGSGWDLEVVECAPGTRGFNMQPRRWVVERRFAWLSRNRRLAKDYERKVQMSETLIEIAATRLVLRRLAGQCTPAPGEQLASLPLRGNSSARHSSARHSSARHSSARHSSARHSIASGFRPSSSVCIAGEACRLCFNTPKSTRPLDGAWHVAHATDVILDHG
jgi:transposase